MKKKEEELNIKEKEINKREKEIDSKLEEGQKKINEKEQELNEKELKLNEKEKKLNEKENRIKLRQSILMEKEKEKDINLNEDTMRELEKLKQENEIIKNKYLPNISFKHKIKDKYFFFSMNNEYNLKKFSILYLDILFKKYIYFLSCSPQTKPSLSYSYIGRSGEFEFFLFISKKIIIFISILSIYLFTIYFPKIS